MIKRLKSCLILLFVITKSYAQTIETTSPLPDALKTIDGITIDKVSDWEKKRRPEILTLFEDNIYGQMPKKFDKISYKTTNEVANAMNGKANLKEVDIKVEKDKKTVTIHLILFIPVKATKNSPVFLLINNRGKENTDPTRKVKSEFWPAEMAIDSGYAIAAFHISDAAPDNKDTYQNSVLQLYPEQLNADNGMKAIGAWAWAASRVMDYFKTNKDIDFNKVSLVGHSRGGKAALWAGAQDKRFAMIFASCSGNTGAALARRKVGESIKAINTTFPHWFNNNYKRFNDNADALPVDQHLLISLIAPRPVYTTSATEDIWADPVGSYMSISEAQKVYSLYGKKSGLSPNPPAVNTPIIQSILGYHNREGIHNMTAYDWGNFIRFAGFHYK
ncbi:glucuronyl esterase domain-containing protein [Emticicia soli]|uniref:Acetylxylan esterase n=1 Tax=Emticicia soli TaxID=2027878 RepID=A0ABW5J7E2_9BACT